MSAEIKEDKYSSQYEVTYVWSNDKITYSTFLRKRILRHSIDMMRFFIYLFLMTVLVNMAYLNIATFLYWPMNWFPFRREEADEPVLG